MKQPAAGHTAGRKGPQRNSSSSSTAATATVKTERTVTVAVPTAARKTAVAAGKSAGGAKKAAGRPKALQQPVLQVGDWIDVLDEVGVWNVAQVLGTPSANSVKVRYDGWGADFDELVRLDSGRVAPYHTYTWSVKCWVKYLNWPWWPAVVTVRPPGNDAGIENLQTVDKLFVNFLDPKNFTFWIKRKDVVAFTHRFEHHCQQSTGADFESSLTYALQSGATPELPAFATGTLPKKFATTEVPSVAEKRREMGDAQWLAQFARNRELHSAMCGGKNGGAKATKGKAAALGKSKAMPAAAKSKAAVVAAKSDPLLSSPAKPLRFKVAKRAKQLPKAEELPRAAAAARTPPMTLVLNESVAMSVAQRAATASSAAATRSGKVVDGAVQRSKSSATVTVAALVSDDSESDSADDYTARVRGGPHYPSVGAAPDARKVPARRTGVAGRQSVQRNRGVTPEQATHAVVAAATAEPKTVALATKTRRMATRAIVQTDADISASAAKVATVVVPGSSAHKRPRADMKNAGTADVKVPAGSARATRSLSATPPAYHVKPERPQHKPPTRASPAAAAPAAAVVAATAADRVRWRLKTTGAAGDSGAASLVGPADDSESDTSSSETDSSLRKRLKRATAAYAESFITEPFPKHKLPVGVSSSAVALSLGVGDLVGTVKREWVDPFLALSSPPPQPHGSRTRSALGGAKGMNAVGSAEAVAVVKPEPAVIATAFKTAAGLSQGTAAAAAAAAARSKTPVPGKRAKLVTATKTHRSEPKRKALAPGSTTSKAAKTAKLKTAKPNTGKRDVAAPSVKFSPSGSARLRMMRVGAPVIQSAELDAEHAARALVCISAPNKFAEPSVLPPATTSPVAAPPLTLSLPLWSPAPLPRGTVFSSSDGFSAASWLQRMMLPTRPDCHRKGKGLV